MHLLNMVQTYTASTHCSQSEVVRRHNGASLTATIWIFHGRSCSYHSAIWNFLQSQWSPNCNKKALFQSSAFAVLSQLAFWWNNSTFCWQTGTKCSWIRSMLVTSLAWSPLNKNFGIATGVALNECLSNVLAKTYWAHYLAEPQICE